VASDVGYCVTDRSREPLDGEEVRACWEAAPAAPSTAGLFEDLEPRSAPAAQSAAAKPRPQPRTRAFKAPLEELRAAAWAEVPQGDLVDAPQVEPGRTVMSEVKRRRRSWRR